MKYLRTLRVPVLRFLTWQRKLIEDKQFMIRAPNPAIAERIRQKLLRCKVFNTWEGVPQGDDLLNEMNETTA
jgi:hypothetical protein